MEDRMLDGAHSLMPPYAEELYKRGHDEEDKLGKITVETKTAIVRFLPSCPEGNLKRSLGRLVERGP